MSFTLSSTPQRPGWRLMREVIASSWGMPVLAALATLLVRLRAESNTDVTGLMTWAERMLDGARPYVDFIEINPPGSFLLYVPAVLTGRALGVSPELMSEVIFLGLIAISLALCVRMIAPTDFLADRHRPILLAGAIAVLGVLPGLIFAQREHIGVIALLPALVATALAAEGHRVATWMRLVAGAGGGLAMIAKPHLAMPLAGIVTWCMIAERSLSPALRWEWIAAGIVSTAYIGFCWLAFPTFFTEIVPFIADVYLPVRFSPLVMLMPNGVIIAACLAFVLVALLRTRRVEAAQKILFIAALAATAAFILQAKAWPYQGYPMLAFLFLAILLEVARRSSQHAVGMADGNDQQRRIRLECLLATAVAAIFAFKWFDADHTRDLQAISRIVQTAKANPRIVTISSDVSVGHPLVRMVGGTWVQSVGSLWATYGAQWQIDNLAPSPERRATLARYQAEDAARLANDLRTGRPDIVLVLIRLPHMLHIDGLIWAQGYPEVMHQLENYHEVGRSGEVVVLARKTKP